MATGVDARGGLIRAADGGDLFLDEIRDMPPQVQAGILRVLEERQLTPVGAKIPQFIDVRFFSATNADIEAFAAVGSFRSDLLDRLREGGPIFLPPLRERKEDIPLLVEQFVRDAESLNPGAMRRDVDSDALDKLCTYDWPGNVRELRNCIFSAVNNYPDVEHLVRVHVHIPAVKGPPEKPVAVAEAAVSQTVRCLLEADHPDDLVRVLSAFTFESARPAELAGRLSEIQGAYACLIARYLKAALKATKKSTLDNPDGQILIHPTMKLITGDPRLSASKAADMIKRLLGLCPEAVEPLLSDPILEEAHETALRLRPRQQKPRERDRRS